MSKIADLLSNEEQNQLKANARNYGIGRQFGKLIEACYKMPASITKIDGKLVSVYFYKTGEKYAPSIEKGKVVMVKVSKSETYVEYGVEDFIAKYDMKK